LLAGVDYYICIEGYVESNGFYNLSITALEPWPDLRSPRLVHNINPENTATGVSTQPTLTWDFGLLTETYDILFDTVNPPVTQVISGAEAGIYGAYTPIGPLQNMTTYYWTVISHNSLTTLPNYTYLSFRTDAPNGLHVSNVSPINGAEGIPTDTSITWDFAPNTLTYDLYVDIVNPPLRSIVTGEQANGSGSFTPSGFSSSTNYYWKIVTRNTSLGIVTEDSFRFGTVSRGPVITIGDSLQTNAHLPINPGTNYSYSQSIYYQSDINTQNGKIDYLCYRLNHLGNLTNCNGWTIYMGHTDKAVFESTRDWIPISQLIEIYHGAPPIINTDGWLEFELSTPFYYNNTDNIVIAVLESQAGSTNGSEDFYCSSAYQDRSIYVSSNSNPIDQNNPPYAEQTANWFPNIKLFLGEMSNEAQLRYYPQNCDFGVLYTHYTSETQCFNLQNIGLENMIIQSVSLNDTINFTLIENNSFPLVLSATETIKILAEFNPLSGGTFSGRIKITDQTDQEYYITLTGEGVDVTISSLPHSESFDDATLPAGWTVIPDYSGWRLANNEFGGHGATNEASDNGGYYMGIDDSPLEAIPDHLISPPIDLSNFTNPCLSFKYWIGDDINYSTLYLDVINQDLIPDNLSEYSQLFGATSWTSSVVDLTQYTGQIISLDFRGINGQGTKGDICLDDVLIFDGSDANEDETSELPDKTVLHANYPNPFNPETTISFSLREQSHVNLDIYNVKGQHLRSLRNDILDSGIHTIVWNGRDSHGDNVTSGIYFYRLQAGTYTKTRKMILMK
jgi:hypothetical protein